MEGILLGMKLRGFHSIAWHRKRCILRAICTQNTYFHIARYMHGLPVARNMRGVHYEYILRAICATFIIYRGHVQMLRNERKLGLAYCAQSARSVNHAHIPRNMHMTEWGPINCTVRGTYSAQYAHPRVRVVLLSISARYPVRVHRWRVHNACDMQLFAESIYMWGIYIESSF